jgi:hypothetical protein
MAAHEVHKRFYEIGSPQGLAELDALLRGDRTRTRKKLVAKVWSVPVRFPE